jgi:hypothetical protein
MINLTPNASEHPVQVAEEEYYQLVYRKEKGWSHCDSRLEYLAKLHYLREGFANGKIEELAFKDREAKLVLGWWAQDL